MNPFFFVALGTVLLTDFLAIVITIIIIMAVKLCKDDRNV